MLGLNLVILVSFVIQMLMVYAFGWVDTLAFDALGIMAIVIVSQQDQKKYPGHVED